ncbi:MAG: glycosyltransferase family 39 protein [Microgenomates group bacterium]
MTKYIDKITFWTVLLLAIFFRLYQLSSLPSGLNWDEISHGYNSYSILHTGKDQWGISYPIFNFRAYGDFPTVLNMYLTIPFIKLFGLNSLTIRLPNALVSIIFVVYSYLFAKITFKKNSMALLSMTLAAFLPWSFFVSRGVFQSTFSMTLILMGLFHFYKSFKNPYHFLLSLLFFGLSLYSYHNARIIIPVLLPFIIVYYRFQLFQSVYKNKKIVFTSILIILFLFIPNLVNLFSPTSFARNRWVGIINPNSINLLNNRRNEFVGPAIINRLLNNRPLYFIQTLTLNYLNLFNPIPLFFSGTQNQQLSVPDMGIIFPILLPFLYIGLYLSLKNKIYLPILFILLISLLPAALTVGDYPVLRASSALIFYILFITLGLSQLKNMPSIIPILTIFIFFILYWSKYKNYNYHYSSTWQYGYQSVVDYIKKNYNQYDQIVITKKYGEPHEFVLFYWPWDPAKYQSDTHLSSNFHSDWYWVDSFDKFIFKNDWEIKNSPYNNKTLLITSPGNYPLANSHYQKSINFLNQTPAFDIISYE